MVPAGESTAELREAYGVRVVVGDVASPALLGRLGLASAAALGGLVAGVPPWAPGGDGLLRHLVEGSFVYIDPMMIMATAIFFMKCIEESGLLSALSLRILRHLGHRL